MKLQQILEAKYNQRSLVSFIRKHAGVRGKSEHTGRGAWWMHAAEPYDWQEMVQQLYGQVSKWKRQGILLDAVRYENEALVMLFSAKYFNPYYRMFITQKPNPDNPWQQEFLGTIGFTMPDTEELEVKAGGRRV